MAGIDTTYSDQRNRTDAGDRGRGSRPVGTFLGSADPSAEAAALAADLAALVDAGLIRRVRDGGEIRFELAELDDSIPDEEA
jgi:hypothetical protein